MKLTKFVLPLLLLSMVLLVAGCAPKAVLLIEGKYEDVDLLDWTHLDTWFEDEEEKKAAPEQPEHLYADFTIAKGYSTNPALNGFQLHSLNVEAVVEGKTYVFKSINPNDVKLPASIFGEGDIFSLSTGTRHFPAVLPVTENYEEVTEGAFWLTQYDEENDTLVANILVLIKWGEGFFEQYEEPEEGEEPDPDAEFVYPEFVAVLELVDGKLMTTYPFLFVDGVPYMPTEELD